MAVGDLNSTAKGTGARFNDGKTPYELIPVRILADAAASRFACSGDCNVEGVRNALKNLALWQESLNRKYLLEASAALGGNGFGGIAWDECAQVFDYGRKKKYAEWNWLKGQAWSVPLACAIRHLGNIYAGELIDSGEKGSGLPHRGHFLCNMCMLYMFQDVYPEGNDLPSMLIRSVINTGLLPNASGINASGINAHISDISAIRLKNDTVAG